MRNVLIGLGLILILIIAAILLLPFLIDLNKYQNYYQPMIEEALNRKIVLKNLRLSIIPRIGVRIAGFTVMDDPAFSTGPFASLESLDIGIQFKPLLSGRIEIDDVTLKEPVISVIKNHQGVFNVSTLGKGGPSVAAPPPPGPVPQPTQEGPLRALALLAVDRVALQHGRLLYQDQTSTKPAEHTVQDLNILLQSVRLGEMPRLHLDAVVQPYNLPISIDGVVGPLVETLDFKTIDVALALGKITASITGRAVGGHADLTVASPLISTADLPFALPLIKPVQIKDLHVKAEAEYPSKPNTPPLEAVTVNVLHGAVLLGNAVITVDGSLLEGKARLLATSPTLTTADLPIVARLPLSRYRKFFRGFRSRSRPMLWATAFPCCMAAGATPGTILPLSSLSEARSPMAKTSGCPGTLRSRFTNTRPARSVGAPSFLPSGEAATPAAHNVTAEGMRVLPTYTAPGSIPVTKADVCTSTPSFCSWRTALSDMSGE